MLQNMKQNLHIALSFLTILIKGKEYSEESMQKSVYYYPFAGVVIFFLSACFSIVFFPLFKNYVLSALLFLFAECILTRGLHHDGLADIADAWGSGKRGEAFRTILKDSRIGSFGVIALIFYFLFALVLMSELLELDTKTDNIPLFFSQMLFAGLWSRLGLLTLPAVCCCYESNPPKFSLAKILFANFQRKYFFYWYACIFFASAFCFDITLPLICTVISVLFSLPLYKLAKRENGYNGDFLGANCLLWELAAYLSLFLFYQGFIF